MFRIHEKALVFKMSIQISQRFGRLTVQYAMKHTLRRITILLVLGVLPVRGPAHGEEPPVLWVADWAVEPADQGFVASWTAVNDAETAYYQVERAVDEDGPWASVSGFPLEPIMGDPLGGLYRLTDPAPPAGRLYYRLRRIDRRGNDMTFGPLSVWKPAKEVRALTAPSSQPFYTRIPHTHDAKPETGTAMEPPVSSDASAEPKVEETIPERLGGRLKITVRQPGLYALAVSRIATAFGRAEDTVREDLLAARWALTAHGRRVAYGVSADTNALVFYNPGFSSIYTDDNVFWLESGRGLVLPDRTVDAPTYPLGKAYRSFRDSLCVESNGWYLTGESSPVTPSGDYWLWDWIWNAGTKSFGFRLHDAEGADDTAELGVILVSANESGLSTDALHNVTFELNGQTLGQDQWGDISWRTNRFSVDPDILSNGINTLSVILATNQVGYPSIVYVDRFAIDYERGLKAVSNALFFGTGEGEDYYITDFSAQDVELWDLTQADYPRRCAGYAVLSTNGHYAIRFAPSSTGRQYAALTPEAFLSATQVVWRSDDRWRSVSNAADYLVIAPNSMTNAARRLADYRQTNGWITATVDLETVYDRCAWGLRDPNAITRFIAHAYANWSLPPERVLLVGEGSFDYKDYRGTGECKMPVIMVGTPWGLYGADTRYGMVAHDDDIPDVVIGRLPASDAIALSNMIDRMIAYERSSAGAWTQQVVVAADDPDEAGDFPADSDAWGELLVPPFMSNKVYLSEHDVSVARPMLIRHLNAGALVFNYVGHGSTIALANNLLTKNDASALTNGTRRPVFLGMTCLAGRHEQPNYDCLAEYLMTNCDGGAVATFTATGESLNSQARLLDQAIAQRLAEGDRDLGGMILGAFQDTAPYVSSFMRDIYNLLGDPALRLR